MARPADPRDGVRACSVVAAVPSPRSPGSARRSIDDKAYLFDARLGLPIPGPDGKGVATLDQALADPAILERMDLPGQSPYGTSRASLLASPTKIGILIDSSQGYFSPKMKLLQRELAGKNRTVLYRDPAEQRDHFAQVLGDRTGRGQALERAAPGRDPALHQARVRPVDHADAVPLPPRVPAGLCPDQAAARRSRRRRPGVRDRSGWHENVPSVINKKKTIPKEIQEGLDVYATYYLGLAHLERNDLRTGRAHVLEMLLELLPEPGPNRPYPTTCFAGAPTPTWAGSTRPRGDAASHRPLHPGRSDHAASWQPAAGPRARLAGPHGGAARSAAPRTVTEPCIAVRPGHRVLPPLARRPPGG